MYGTFRLQMRKFHKFHENITKISVKDSDPERSKGRIRMRIENDPLGRIWIRN